MASLKCAPPAPSSSALSLPKIQVESRNDILFLKNGLKKECRALLHSDKVRTRVAEWAESVDLTRPVSARVAAKRKRAAEEAKQETVEVKEELSKVEQVEGMIEKHLNKWVDHLFELAGPNIEVNGMDYEKAMKATKEYEPLDEELKSKVEQAVVKQNAILEELAQLKAQMPREFMAWLEVGLAAASDTFDKASFAESNQENAVPSSLEDDVAQFPFEPLEQDYSSGLAVLEASKKTVPQTLAKMRQASCLLDFLNVSRATVEPNQKLAAQSHSSLPSNGSTSNITPRSARVKLLNRIQPY